jgi:hypothetical protein
MRYLLTAVLVLCLAAPAVFAGKDVVKVVKGKGIAAPAAEASQDLKAPTNVRTNQRSNVQYRTVTLLGGKLTAHVAVQVR